MKDTASHPRRRVLPRALGTGIALALVVGSVVLTVTGCGPSRRDEPVTERLDASDPRVAAGERVFAAHCYQCHPGGSGGLGPAINDKPLPVALIKTQVRQGLGTMPAFPPDMISDDQLDALARYLKGLRNLREVAAR